MMTGNIAITLNLTIDDAELCADLGERPEGDERDQFAITAMRIGAMALRQAIGRIDAEQVRSEGDRLIDKMKSALEEHQNGVTGQIRTSLSEYFDPESRRFDERVQRLIGSNGHDGELALLIKNQIGGDGSELARTLTAHVGESSPLMQTLNPDASSGLISILTKATESTLSEQRESILKEFSLDNGEGALSRLVGELKNSNGNLMREFDLNVEDSALKRLMSGVESAQRQITSEFSLDEEGSALARMRQQLLDVLDKQGKANQDFQTEVRESLAAMTARRQEAERSTRHGAEFEDAVFDFIYDRSQRAGHIATRTGSTVGRINRKRVGDVVVELGPEHSAAGARIVVEAKENSSYRPDKALEEMQEARDNREADIGIFVFSKSSAPEGIQEFARYGNDIVVVWDKGDSGSDVFLDAGLSVAIALSVRARTHVDEVGADFKAIEQAVLGIQKQADGLSQIKTWATTVRNNGDNIVKNAEKMQEALSEQIDVLNKKVADLKEVLGEAGDVAVAA